MSTQAKRLALNEIRKRVAEFVVAFKGVTSEKTHSQDFWRAFAFCYGVDSTYQQGVRFEYPATRSSTGNQGSIDVFLPGKYLIEQKSAGALKIPKGSEQSNARGSISWLSSAKHPTAQSPSGQRHSCLRHTNRTGTPQIGRSRTTWRRRS